MATCDDRQLTQAELEAGFQQQRSGVVQALRPFIGPRTIDNLCSYVDRELGPAVRNARAKVNDCWQQVTDNAPSANPLGYYFSTITANADPTAGRVRLDASPQNTATTLRVSESNARLQDVSAWLDMMIGGSTIPLGVVTLMDAINPGRFLRGNLTNITPHTGYRDLSITVFEASHPDPFVDSEAVLVSYVPGMADGGVTVPLAVLAPIASDTFLGNVSGAPGAPSAVNLSTLAGAGLGFGTHTLAVTGSTSITIASDEVQRAALTGDVTAALNSNATTIAAHAVTNAKLAQIVAGRVKGLQIDATSPGDVVDLTGAEVGELIRRAFVTDYAGATGTIDDFPLDVRINILRINPGSLGGDVAITGFALGAGGTTGNAGGFFVLVKQGAANRVSLLHEDTGSSGNNRLELPLFQDLNLTAANSAVVWQYLGGRWQIVATTVVSGQLVAVTHYTSGSGTHTYDPRTTYYEAHKQAGGAAGGGVQACTGVQSAAGGGGQAGPIAIAVGVPAAATAAYVVGAGGAGSSGAVGNAGADTSFDGVFTGAPAIGGGLGVASATANAAPGGGDNATGNQGDPGSAGFTSGLLFAAAGKGGSGRYGGGGWGWVITAAGNIDGAIGRKPGAGGSGAVNIGIGSAKAGGPGADGDIWVYEWS